MKRLLAILFALLLLPVVSLTAFAEDYSARLETLHFDIRLLEDGSAQITETRTVSFTGDHEFTRYGVSNVFAGPRVFTDWAVSMDGIPLTMLEGPDNEGRPENTFAVEDGEGENTLYIYHRSRETSRTFQISYRVENAVKLYDDVAEFHWNLTAETGISSIDMLTATLTVPAGIPGAEFRIWAHGPLNGTFEKQDAVSAYLQVAYVPYGEIVDMRATLPAVCFTGGWVQEGEALADILAEEKALADSANAKREEAAREEAEMEAYWAQRDAWAAEHPILDGIRGFCEEICDFFYYNIVDQLFGLVAGLAAAVFGVTAIFGSPRVKTGDVRHKPLHAPQYQRDLPDRRPAPTVDRLLVSYSGTTDTSRQISAAMLELNLKDVIRFRSTGPDHQILLNEQQARELFPQASSERSQSRTYSVRLRRVGDETVVESSTGDHRLSSYHQALWEFLRDAAGGAGYIGMKALKEYVVQNQERACDFRREFESAVGNEHRKWVQTETVKATPKAADKRLLLVPVAVGALALLIRLLSTLYDGMEFDTALLVGGAAFAVTLVLLLAHWLGRRMLPGSCTILDQKSENDLALWQAFGRYLDDFTGFDRTELPEFPLWKEHMVYAVAMGKGEKVAKALAVAYPRTQVVSDEDEAYRRYLEDRALWESLNAVGQEVVTASPPRSESSSDDSWSNDWSDSDGGGGGFSDSGGGSDSGSGGDFAD